jgi:hypothetical protein
LREESEYSAGRSVRPWKLPFTTTRLMVRPAYFAPGSVISLLLTSAMRAASETLSEPEFRHRNLVYGQPLRVWPISLRIARSKRSCERLGVMMLAIACGRAIASMTLSGVWPRPSMP